MLVKTNGIVFKSVKYRETSLILDIYTRELGLRTYIVNGVRKQKSRTSAALLQLMSQVEMVVYEHPGKDINRIKELKPAYLYRNLPYHIQKSSIGIFMLEIARKSIREKESNPTLYDFIEKSYQFLDQSTDPVSSFHLSFMVYLSEKLGFKPEYNFNAEMAYFDMREGSFVRSAPFHRDYFREMQTEALKALMQLPMEKSHHLEIDRKTKNQLLDDLLAYYSIHLGDLGTLKSLEIFRDLFR